jgi:hypothetical protein
VWWAVVKEERRRQGWFIGLLFFLDRCAIQKEKKEGRMGVYGTRERVPFRSWLHE